MRYQEMCMVEQFNNDTAPVTRPSVLQTLIPTPTISQYSTIDTRLAPYVEKLTVTLSDGTTFVDDYTAEWFWCGGSHGKRILPNSYLPFLQPIGTVSSGEVVYTLSSNAPYPGDIGIDQHFFPSNQNEHMSIMSSDQWTQLFSNRQRTYPVLIIKDSSQNLHMYMRHDHLILPGC